MYVGAICIWGHVQFAYFLLGETAKECGGLLNRENTRPAHVCPSAGMMPAGRKERYPA